MKELDTGIEVTVGKGMRRNLTREMVENAARKMVREKQDRRVKKYVVNVAGEDFPLKKLIATALDVTPRLFDAPSAVRWLLALGYEVHNKDSEALNWEKRSPADLVKAIQYALSRGAFAAAQQLAQIGERLHGEDPAVRRLARMLAPAKVLRTNLPPDPGVLHNHEWLKKHASEYRKCWVALENGKLLVSGDSIADVRSQLDDRKGVLLMRIP